MAQADKMTCQECGVLMNHHAEKIDYMASPDDLSAFDPQLGGVIEEAHTCPLCGKTEMRPSQPPHTAGNHFSGDVKEERQ